MNGAIALDWANTTRMPISVMTTTIGTSQYFFSTRRNSINSKNTRDLAIGPPTDCSEHPLEMGRIAIAFRILRPAAECLPPTVQRVVSAYSPDESQRCEQQEKDKRQQNARIEPAQRARQHPPD